MINRIQASANNPFNLADTQDTIREYGIPTVDHVAELETRAQILYSEKKGTEAIDALEAYARAANTLANIIAAGLQPFYDASYDDQQKIPASEINQLAEIERMANDYRRKRDRAYVMQAHCYVSLGQSDKAIPLLIKALELLSMDEAKWWSTARGLLYKIVGVVK